MELFYLFDGAIFRLMVFVVAIVYHHEVTLGVFANAPLRVTPLWNTSYSTIPFCKVEQSQKGFVNFQGTSYYGCSLQIVTSQNYLTAVEIPENSEADMLLYVERLSNLDKCPNKYVLFGEQKVCTVLFKHNHLNLHLFGNASVTVKQVAVNDTWKFECPEYITNFESNLSCADIKGYNQFITCDSENTEFGYFDYVSDVCHIKFGGNCNSYLVKHAVSFLCPDNVSRIKSVLLYPLAMSLNLSQNNIVEVDINAFHHLSTLKELDLTYNKLVELPNNVFRNLSSLITLDLSFNKLTILPGNVFEGLHNLMSLCLHRNQLEELPVEIFQGLGQLSTLKLYRNNLTSLPSGVFAGLQNLSRLDLDDNMLVELPVDLFQGLGQLSELYLFVNNLTSLPSGVFTSTGLQNLSRLDLEDNKLFELPSDLFQGLGNLRKLYIYSNYLTSLPMGVFRSLTNLYDLDLAENELQQLPTELFHSCRKLSILDIHGNKLKALPATVFEGMTSLSQLNLADNQLQELPSDLFKGLVNLRDLILKCNELAVLPPEIFFGLHSIDIYRGSHNKLVKLDKNIFKHLSNLTDMFLGNNKLTDLPSEIFQQINKVEYIFLHNNLLKRIAYDLFYGLVSLKMIILADNRLNELDYRLFKDLSNLTVLMLKNNMLRTFHKDIFKGLQNLEVLILSSNQLLELDSFIFKDTHSIAGILIDVNQLTSIPTFKDLILLTLVNLTDNPLTYVDAKSFVGLPSNINMSVSQQQICECYVPKGINCSASDNRSPYLQCKRLLSDKILVVVMWLVGLNALGGNIFVLIWRRRSSQGSKTQEMLLSNLAFSDLLMGVYMLTLASADLYFGDNFPMQSETWRSGLTCKISGAISIISSEASVFFVTLISIDRFICICFPFSIHKLDRKSVNILAIIIWIISLGLGIVPSGLAGNNFKFYENSNVCIGLPLVLTERFHTDKWTQPQYKPTCRGRVLDGTISISHTKSLGIIHGLYFSVVVFLGLNFLCYFIIFACYVEIIRVVFKSSRRTNLSKEMRNEMQMTVKVAAIVCTDFCCWFPVILMGILVQANVITLPPSVYAWSVTFVLPINSAINPYLYTIAAIISNRKREKELKAGRTSLHRQRTSRIIADTSM